MQAQLSTPEAIEEIASRLVEFYWPVRIYLFGSEARGEAGPDSDLDFCVVLPDNAPASLYCLGFTALSGMSMRRPTWSGFHSAILTREPRIRRPRCRRRCFGRGGCSTTPHELRRDEARRWLRLAARDLHVASLVATEEPSGSVFHSQQCAEK